MSQKSTADLTTENNALVVTQSTPESITPLKLGGNVIQDIIDSVYNKITDPLTPAPISKTKVELAALIAANALNDKQWIKITDRNDGFPLFVCSQGVNLISPYGIWINSGKALRVTMDYVNGFEDETYPFFSYTDATGIFTTATPLKIADGTQGGGKVLVSNIDGQTSWKLAGFGQNSVANPAGMTGSSLIAMGLGAGFTVGKSGNVKVDFSGEYSTDDNVGVTRVVLATTTGFIPPANGDTFVSLTGYVPRRILELLSQTNDTSLRTPFAGSIIITGMAPGAYFIDLGIDNQANGAVQIYNVSLTANEL